MKLEDMSSSTLLLLLSTCLEEDVTEVAQSVRQMQRMSTSTVFDSKDVEAVLRGSIGYLERRVKHHNKMVELWKAKVVEEGRWRHD